MEEIVDANVGGDTNPPKKKWKYIRSETKKLNYDKTVSECDKFQGLIQKVVVRNTHIISQNYYYDVRLKMGNFFE